MSSLCNFPSKWVRLTHKETYKNKKQHDYETHYLRTDNRLNALHIGTRKEPAVTENDSLGNKQRVIEIEGYRD